ncbi:TonB-dependent receptor [Parapedobacter deserti]|uniref:TonB-dependent receptor n=2 Tax=Parapedobacter deserti TaxID=1912957 RepID=A0ABV7JQN3_9SPHI
MSFSRCVNRDAYSRTYRYILIMKLTAFFIVAFFLQSVAESKAQKITLSVRNATLQEVMNSVQRQQGSSFFFLGNKIASTRVSLNIQQMELADAMTAILANRNLDWHLEDNTIVIKRSSGSTTDMLPKSTAKVNQQQTITGTVTDTLGTPLVGVSVAVKESKMSTSTDINGKFVLEAPPGTAATLVFSYVGYAMQEIAIGIQSVFNVVLQADNTGLDEVVVVGFGVQKKITNVGSQATVRPEELKTPVRNLSTVLAGRLSGIVAVQRSGEPGYDNANVWIRGVSSLTGSRSPLVLVDGVQRPFSDLDPEDIESFSILKDASATAVYGVRGANGVILINTRKGKPGRINITTGYNESINQFTRIPSLVDGATYMQIVNEAHTTRGKAARYSDEIIAKTANGEDPDLYPDVNWYSEVFNKFGHNRRANLNMTGGSDRVNFYVSTAYFSEVGLFKRDELQNYNSQIKLDRYNFTTNLSMQATATTKVDLGVQGYIMNGNFPGSSTGGIFGMAMQATPIAFPVLYSNGYVGDQRGGELQNPYAMLTRTGYVTEWRNRINSNIRATQDLRMLIPGLSLTSMFSFDSYNESAARRLKRPDTYLATQRNENGELIFEQTFVGSPYLGFERTNRTSNRNFYTESALNYSGSFGSHQVTGMLLYNQSDYIDNFSEDFIGSLPYRLRGLAGRATYGFKERYLLEANFGYNGSENFLPKRRYGFFPSIGLGWVLSNESFFGSLNEVFPMAKIRFSHGQVGNADIGGRRFAYIGTVGEGAGGYTFGKDWNNSFSGLDIAEYAVDVSWEKATKTNIGIDVDTRIAAGNRLNVQFDLFHERREGSFLRRSSVPAFVGLLNNPYGNLGITENKGLDASLTYNGALSNNFSINVQGTVTYNQNIVIDDDLPPWNYPWRERKGQRIDQRFGLIADGLFRNEEEIENSATQIGDVRVGDIRYRDLNGDGMIDSNDEAPIGYGDTPQLVYGLRTGFKWRQFSMAAFFQGIGNVDILLNGEGLVPFQQGGTRGNLLTIIEDRWTEENQNFNAFYPRLTFGDENMNYRTSSWWVKNGSFLRLKTLDLNYTLNKAFTNRFSLESATIFFQGFNLLTLSEFKVWDVEMGNGRGTNYPQHRTYNLGVQLTF